MAAVASDGELVARCRSGDDEAWHALVERFSRYVFAICVQGFRLPSADAEDVFQEVFLRVHQRLGSLRDDDAVRPWIAQLTRRLCLDRLRSDKRELPSGDELEPPGMDATLLELDDALAVRQALDDVGDPCRELLRALPPAPEGWVRAAQELPLARLGLDDIVERARADAEFRQALIDDLEAALAAAGYETDSYLVEAVRGRLELPHGTT